MIALWVGTASKVKWHLNPISGDTSQTRKSSLYNVLLNTAAIL
jgi:hypothetical protein